MPTTRKITLWYFDYCLSNLGIWTRMWAGSKKELEEKRAWLRSINSGVDSEVTPDDEVDGSYGQNTTPGQVEVAMSPAGIIDFLERYGDANGE